MRNKRGKHTVLAPLLRQREGLAMTTLSTASSDWALHGRQRTEKPSPIVSLALSAGRLLVTALLVAQLGVALVSVLRTQTERLQQDLATTSELAP
jgi:hypothetical protein